MMMLRVRYLVEGQQRVDVGTIAAEQHLPAKEERVLLQGSCYFVKGRSWKYDWVGAASSLETVETLIEIDLSRFP
jgi:hypothetical protein